MDSSIVINKLTKRYGKENPVCALDSLTLEVKSGECYGFLGANGAGKSTTIKLLLNFIQPSSGSAQIMGKDVVADAVQARSSIENTSRVMWHFLTKPTGKELLDYLCSLQGLKDLSYHFKLEKRFRSEISTNQSPPCLKVTAKS